MGQWGQGKMVSHQQKKLDDEALLAFRDRFSLPLSDDDVTQFTFQFAERRRARNEISACAPPGAWRLCALAYDGKHQALTLTRAR